MAWRVNRIEIHGEHGTVAGLNYGQAVATCCFLSNPWPARSPLCSCHRPQAVSVWLPFNSRSLRHPFKIPGWFTYQVVYVHTRGIPMSAPERRYRKSFVRLPRTHALLLANAEALRRAINGDKILLRLAFPRYPSYLRAAENT